MCPSRGPVDPLALEDSSTVVGKTLEIITHLAWKGQSLLRPVSQAYQATHMKHQSPVVSSQEDEFTAPSLSPPHPFMSSPKPTVLSVTKMK